MRFNFNLGRGLASVALAACALPALSSTAHADAAIELPNGQNSYIAANGVRVSISRTDESATVSPALAANGFSRTAWVSGNVLATVPGAAAGELHTGYLIGCQTDLSRGFTVGGGLALSLSSANPSVAASVALKPGGVATVELGKKDLARGATALGYSYHNRGIQVDGCGGRAQARSYSRLQVTDNDGSSEVTLYGAPFDLR